MKNYQKQKIHKYPNQIFLFDVEGDDIIAALQGEIQNEILEVKWLGSLKAGHGKQLLNYLSNWAKKMQIRSIQVTAKFDSGPFYDKMNFQKIPDSDKGRLFTQHDYIKHI